MNQLRVAGIVLFLAGAGCSASTEPGTQSEKVSVGSAADGELSVELLTDTRLETGMTPIYLRIAASGQPVTDASVTFVPLMTMTGTMSHSAPVIGPVALDSDGDYRCDVVFQMATSEMGSWSATVKITRTGGAPVEVAFPSLAVADSGRAKTFLYTDPATSAQTKYVASLNFSKPPKVGLNTVVLTLHERVDAMTFVPVLDATMTMDPQMPSMGHGSPGSVNPTATSQGRYEGQLSFSMAGAWETTVAVERGGVAVGKATFATEF